MYLLKVLSGRFSSSIFVIRTPVSILSSLNHLSALSWVRGWADYLDAVVSKCCFYKMKQLKHNYQLDT